MTSDGLFYLEANGQIHLAFPDNNSQWINEGSEWLGYTLPDVMRNLNSRPE
jgi:hypothetical protein